MSFLSRLVSKELGFNLYLSARTSNADVMRALLVVPLFLGIMFTMSFLTFVFTTAPMPPTDPCPFLGSRILGELSRENPLSPAASTSNEGYLKIYVSCVIPVPNIRRKKSLRSAWPGM